MRAPRPPVPAIFLLIRGLNCFQLICDNRSIDTRSAEWRLSHGRAGAPENRLLISMYFNNVGGNGSGRRRCLIDWFQPLYWAQGRRPPPLLPPPLLPPPPPMSLNDRFWVTWRFALSRQPRRRNYSRCPLACLSGGGVLRSFLP